METDAGGASVLRVADNAEKVADVVDCNLTAHRPVQVRFVFAVYSYCIHAHNKPTRAAHTHTHTSRAHF